MKKFVIPEPKKGSSRTPDKERQAKSKEALKAGGGKRVSVNLTEQAVADLAAIKARDGLDNTGAVIAALRCYAESELPD